MPCCVSPCVKTTVQSDGLLHISSSTYDSNGPHNNKGSYVDHPRSQTDSRRLTVKDT